MSKINKIFIIIISTFVMMFYKVYQVLALEIPSASYPSSLNYIKTRPSWFLLMELVGWGLLLLAFIFVVLGIIAFSDMKEQEKVKNINSNIDDDYLKKEVTIKFERIIRWTMVILIIATVYIIATIIIINKYSFEYSYKYPYHAYDPTLVCVVIMDIVAIVATIVWLLSRDKAIRKTQQMHQRQKQNEDHQFGNQPNTIDQDDQ